MGVDMIGKRVICMKSINYNIGDIVVYDSCKAGWCWCNSSECLVIHRIVDIQDGCYITKGDANPVTDPVICLNKNAIKCKVIWGV